MDRPGIYYTRLTLYLMLSLLVLLGGCSDNRSEVLGIGEIGAVAPTVTAVAPANNASGVLN